MDVRELGIVAPLGYEASSCGYCRDAGQKRSKSPTSCSYYAWVRLRALTQQAVRLTPANYQGLIDCGWRRSGSCIYKPDNARTCCPQHPIR